VLRTRTRQSAGTLSGGEQEMLAIARALMSKPKLCIFDEPSLGLAPKVVAEVEQTLARIKAMGVTILLVEQNASMALRLADRAYVYEAGEIVLQGTGAELQAHPKSARPTWATDACGLRAETLQRGDRHMKKFAKSLVTSLAVATTALACLSAGAAEKELLIGVNDSLTGPGAVYGLPQANAVQMAADEINAAGGIKAGRDVYKLRVIANDDKANPTEATNSVRKLIDRDGVKYLLGFCCSGPTSAVASFIERETR